MDNKKGLSFSLEELKEGLDILMSRPPRRINNYAARQVLTDVTYGQGRGVTEFNQSIAPLHVPSESTRKASKLSPAGICPVVVQMVNLIHPRKFHTIASLRKDVPYLNTKKSNQYDPCYCRRQGIHKEGWCGICKKGGWFLMKNSGYLYHQNHEHGISRVDTFLRILLLSEERSAEKPDGRPLWYLLSLDRPWSYRAQALGNMVQAL